MGETRIMHYVPQSYMRYFSQERKGGFYINALLKDGGKIFSTNIKNMCAERDLYMIPGETEEERQLIEKIYNDLYEAGYDRLYAMLTDPKKEELTAGERYAIIGFVVSMYFRNNAWNSFYDRVMDDMLSKAYALTVTNEKDSFFFEDQEISIVGKTLIELQKDYRKEGRPLTALQSVQTMFRAIRLRVENDFVSVIRAVGNFEFITSDNPVVAKPPKGERHLVPMNPQNSLWIPIDNKHLLQLNPWAGELDGSMLGRLTDGPFPGIQTSMNNAFQGAQAGKFLLGTEVGLNQFEGNRAGIFTRVAGRS
jgi:uncharacterized protein DUF4238